MLRDIYLADDDSGDRDFFADAVLEIDPDVIVKQAHDGMCLMDNLSAEYAKFYHNIWIENRL